MRHAPLVATEVISHQARTRRSIFRSLVAALYRYRRLRAERTLKRYHDVIHQAKLGIARELKSGSERP